MLPALRALALGQVGLLGVVALGLVQALTLVVLPRAPMVSVVPRALTVASTQAAALPGAASVAVAPVVRWVESPMVLAPLVAPSLLEDQALMPQAFSAPQCLATMNAVTPRPYSPPECSAFAHSAGARSGGPVVVGTLAPVPEFAPVPPVVLVQAPQTTRRLLLLPSALASEQPVLAGAQVLPVDCPLWAATQLVAPMA